MKLSVNVIFQLLATLGQGANAIYDFVPLKYKWYVAAAIGFIQMLAGWRASYFNPDGTPAREPYVKKSGGTGLTNLFTMLFFLTLLCVPCMAQEKGYENFVAAGASWNQYASPQIAGSLLYAKRLGADDSTYSFNYVDLISKNTEQFSTATSITAGIAQKLLVLGKAKVYGTTGVGIMAGGENIGYSWTAGGAVAIPLGKGFQVLPNVRVIKSSLTDFQAIYGLMIGWGK